MIHEFTGRGRIFWFPKAWANSVVRWICGVFSPSGTIQVTNNLSPDGEGSLALDVNVNAVAKRIAEMRDDREITQGRVESTTHIVRGLLDGQSVNFDGEHVSVNRDWVADIAKEAVGDASECDCAEKWASQATADAARDDNIAQAQSDAADALDAAKTASTNATDAKTAAEAAKTSAEGAQSTADAAAAKIAAVTVSVGSGDATATKVPLSALTGSIDGHAGTCLVTIGNDGSLGHTGKSGSDVTLLGAAADRMNKGDGTTKLLTDADLSDDDIKNLDDIATAAADGTVTQDITVCTGIAWQYVSSAGGYALVFTTQTLKFESGLLVEVGAAKSTYNEYDGKAS